MRRADDGLSPVISVAWGTSSPREGILHALIRSQSGNHRIARINWWDGTILSEITVPQPEGMAVDDHGDLFLLTSDHRVRKYVEGTNYESEWSHSFTPGEGPQYITVDHGGNIYLSFSDLNRVVKFDGDGNLLFDLGGVRGSLPGQFSRPQDIVIDRMNRLYVVDPGNRQVQIFTPDGRYLHSLNMGWFSSSSTKIEITPRVSLSNPSDPWRWHTFGIYSDGRNYQTAGVMSLADGTVREDGGTGHVELGSGFWRQYDNCSGNTLQEYDCSDDGLIYEAAHDQDCDWIDPSFHCIDSPEGAYCGAN